MNIHEYQGAELFKQYGIPVPEGELAINLEGAAAFAKKTGFPVVLKAQVLTGGRGKAGGVQKANNEQELKGAFNKIMGMDIKGFKVKKLLIAKALDIAKEIYLGITTDRASGDIVCIASSKGGVDIEDIAHRFPDEIFKLYLNVKKNPSQDEFINFLKPVFDKSEDRVIAAEILSKLFKLFTEKDCTLIEINPFAQDKNGRYVAADAKINFDDNALFRHPDIDKLRDFEMEDADEAFARDCGLSFVKLEGEIGCIVNGAGLAMATMDVIKNMGGKPMNFLDVGGSSNPGKVINAFKIIIKNPGVKAILINIFGGITRCDDVANGIIAAHDQLKINIPIVVRLTGTNEVQAKELLSKKGINTYTSMKEAVEKVVGLERHCI